MLNRTALIDRFFNWFGDHGCFFPNMKPYNGTLSIIDIDTMYSALKYLYVNTKTSNYFVKLDQTARKKGLVCDSMKIIPWYESDQKGVDIGFLYNYNKKIADEYPPECQSSYSLTNFIKKFPNATKLI